MIILKKALQTLAVALLVAASLYSSVQYLRQTLSEWVPEHLERDPVEVWEDRLAPLKADLPMERGTIGYVADWDVPGVAYYYRGEETEYILTQYTLAPLVLARGVEYEWIVANFSPEAAEIWLRSLEGRYKITGYKYGLYLIQRLNP